MQNFDKILKQVSVVPNVEGDLAEFALHVDGCAFTVDVIDSDAEQLEDLFYVVEELGYRPIPCISAIVQHAYGLLK